jgi:hypothetical protein
LKKTFTIMQFANYIIQFYTINHEILYLKNSSHDICLLHQTFMYYEPWEEDL